MNCICRRRRFGPLGSKLTQVWDLSGLAVIAGPFAGALACTSQPPKHGGSCPKVFGRTFCFRRWHSVQEVVDRSFRLCIPNLEWVFLRTKLELEMPVEILDFFPKIVGLVIFSVTGTDNGEKIPSWRSRMPSPTQRLTNSHVTFFICSYPRITHSYTST